MKLLIVVPTLNSYLLLRNLINSLRDQTFKSWRVLFIEGKEVPNSNLLEHEAWDALASYKRPREIRFLRMFPRNTMGKIKLDELRTIANGKVSVD